jgi:hypothetical protein
LVGLALDFLADGGMQRIGGRLAGVGRFAGGAARISTCWGLELKRAKILKKQISLRFP